MLCRPNLATSSHGGSVVASATGGLWSEDPTGRAADIDDLYVDPDHFRQGIGALLLAHVERELIVLGYRLAVLWVRECERYSRPSTARRVTTGRSGRSNS